MLNFRMRYLRYSKTLITTIMLLVVLYFINSTIFGKRGILSLLELKKKTEQLKYNVG